MQNLIRIVAYGFAFVMISLLLQGCDNMQKSMATVSDGSSKTNEPTSSSGTGAEDSNVGTIHALEKSVADLEAKVAAMEGQKANECKQTCDDRKLYGRYHNLAYSHSCWNADNELICRCTSTPEAPEECVKLETTTTTPVMSLAETLSAQDKIASDKMNATIVATQAHRVGSNASGAPALLQSQARSEDVSTARDSAINVEEVLQEVRAHGRGSSAAAASNDAGEPPLPGSVQQIVGDFCDASQLKEMQGQGQAVSDKEAVDTVEDVTDEDGGTNQLESAILADVANELETNNVDKMAKEIFTFYMCVRWVPDKTFFELAIQEMAANVLTKKEERDVEKGVKGVASQDNVEHAIAELYQTFKYVPLLCSKNLVVFGEKHQDDFTYYRKFKEKVDEMSTWLENAKGSLVSERLRQTDETFCGAGQKMNAKGCDIKLNLNDKLNTVASIFGVHLDTREDQWTKLYDIFKQFEGDGGAGGGEEVWQKNVQEWKSRFPYHSFINKNEAIDASQSPEAHQRIVVCFGKRVASEMHRRPSGQHLLTDQNNIGCHGWWDEEEGAKQLQNLATLWRPPTCQLAEMTYTMKREILTMFAKMNERLFDALPTMLTDEFLKEEGKLEAHVLGEGPYEPKHITIGNEQYVEDMRVALQQDVFNFPAGGPDCNMTDLWQEFKRKATLDQSVRSSKCLILQRGAIGTVKLGNEKLNVIWDRDEDKAWLEMKPEQLRVMPHKWEAPKDFFGHMKDLVAGVGELKDKASMMFGSMFSSRYTNLASMMSGSVSKWVVCPVKPGVDMEKLDAHLGVEDAAFQDFQKEAYAKFTKFKAKVPGEECEKPTFAPFNTEIKFSQAEVCEISVLHADHVEKFTYMDDTPLGDLKKGELEPFVCPMKPSLPSEEQLEILRQKKSKCYLHMNEEQLRHYSWIYNGKHPARRQHDRKDNVPLTEYEILKVVKVSTGADSETSFGRYCTVDELATTPRFCEPPELYNPWMDLEQFGEALEDAAAGALGIGSSAIAGAISLYQSGLKNRSAKENALILKEKTWDALTGAGRLLKSGADAAVSKVVDTLPGDKRRADALQRKHFRTIETGLGLHSLSYQRSIGHNGRTSNAKERYQRYVVTVPCHGYDPVIRFQIEKKWGDGVLRMVKEAYGRANEVLTAFTHLELVLRGEARLFEGDNVHTENPSFYSFQAGMQWPKLDGSEHQVKIKCSGNRFSGCKPAHQCTPSGLFCEPRTEYSPSDWWAVEDQKLAAYVGGQKFTSGSGDKDLSKVYGFRMSLYCGAKTAFKKTGGSEPQDASLLDCLHRGVRENAKMRALQPWRVYFPEEVVVVALFERIVGRRCNPAPGISAELREMLCFGNTTTVENLDGHVHKEPPPWSGGGTYRGLHTGEGFARGTPSEVVLRPEDVLDAVGLMAS